MDDLENTRREASFSGWSIATALGLLAVAFLIDRGAPPNDEASPIPPKEERGTSLAGLATESGDRGRHATSPSEIPAKGWKDILLRVYGTIGDHRILALAAGMTYYSILAIFPAIAAFGSELLFLLMFGVTSAATTNKTVTPCCSGGASSRVPL